MECNNISGKTQNIPQWHLQNTYLLSLIISNFIISFKVCNSPKNDTRNFCDRGEKWKLKRNGSQKRNVTSCSSQKFSCFQDKLEN